MFEFELDRSSKKSICPQCSQKKFVLYLSNRTGANISFDVGKCDRENGCGYHRPPKEFFLENPHLSNDVEKKKPRPNYGFANVGPERADAPVVSKPVDYIPKDAFLMTLDNYEKNAFASFLLDLFSEDKESVENAIKSYFVGTYTHSRGDYTCFPSIDAQRRVCRAKLIRFNQATGKRLKDEFDTSSLPAMLKLKDFHYKQIFFGEHLLTLDKLKPVAVVEAEKTAIIASICFPQFIWLGSNSKQWLNAERLERIGNRQIILYPDADGFDTWTERAKEARLRGLTVKVSSLIETHATDEQKAGGYDLADYLIHQQKEINRFNSFTDDYNARLETVLQSETLRADFDLIIDEQKAVMMIDGGQPEAEAERLAMRAEHVRRVVMSL